MKGRVTRKINDRKFGFIRGDDAREYFFHQDDCYGEFDRLTSETKKFAGDGSEVSFDGEPGKEPGKLRARNVVPA
jgi:cold shock CspA family protein